MHYLIALTLSIQVGIGLVSYAISDATQWLLWDIKNLLTILLLSLAIYYNISPTKLKTKVMGMLCVALSSYALLSYLLLVLTDSMGHEKIIVIICWIATLFVLL